MKSPGGVQMNTESDNFMPLPEIGSQEKLERRIAALESLFKKEREASTRIFHDLYTRIAALETLGTEERLTLLETKVNASNGILYRIAALEAKLSSR